MKHASTTLFEIITRMTDDEKKYFRIYSTILKQFKHISTVRLLELFEAISNLKVYNETKLKSRLVPVLSEKSFRTYKSVLRELILESLYAHRNSGNASDTQRRQLNHAETLMIKDLNHQALAHINHLQQHTDSGTQQPDALHKMELLTLKNKVLQNLPGTDAAAKAENRLELYRQSLILQHNQQQEYITTYLLQMVSQRLLLPTEADVTQLKEMQKITSCHARKVNNPNDYYVVQQSACIALLEGNFVKYLDHCHHLFSHYHQLAEKEQLDAETQHHYAETFINLIRACVLAKDTEMLMLTFNAALRPYTRVFAAQPYYYAFLQYAFLLMLRTDNVETDLSDEAQQFETNYCPAPPENDVLRYRWFRTTLAVTYHRSGNYKAALQQCHRVLATNPRDLNEIHCRDFCNLFQFIIHYDMLSETSKTDLSADTLLEATRNKLQREHGLTGEKKNHSFELCILDYIADPTEEARSFCLAELELLQHLPAAKHFNTVFDFEQWLQPGMVNHQSITVNGLS